MGGLEYGSDDRRGGRSDRKGRRDKREHERDRDRGLEDDGAGPFASRFQNLSDVAGQVIRGCLHCQKWASDAWVVARLYASAPAAWTPVQ